MKVNFLKNISRVDILTGLLFALTIYQGASKYNTFPLWSMVGDELLMVGIALVVLLTFLTKENPPKGWLIPLIPLVSLLLSWMNTGMVVTSFVYSIRAYFVYIPAMWWSYVHYRLPENEELKTNQIPQSVLRMLKIIFLVFLVQTPFFILQFIDMVQKFGYQPDWVYGLFGDSNVAGYFVGLLMLILFPIWVANGNKRLLAVLYMSFLAMLLFGARAAVLVFISYVLLVALYRFFWQKNKSWSVFLFFGVTLLTTGIYTILFGDQVLSLLNWNRFSMMERTVEHGANRFLWMEKTWEQLTVTHPGTMWLGFGPGNHSSYYAQKRGSPIWKNELYNAFGQLEKGQDTSVDSQFIPILGEFGIIGLIFFYGTWLWFALRTVTLEKIIKGLLGTRELIIGGLLIFWLVNSYTNHIWELPPLALAFYFFMGMALESGQHTPKEKKGVLFFVHSFWPVNGGVEQQALRQAKGLIAQGYDVRVLTAKHSAGLKKFEIVETVPVYRFSYPYWVPFKPAKKLLNVLYGAIAFLRTHKKFNFKILHIHQMQWLTIVGYLFKDKFGYKIIAKGTSSGVRSDAIKFYETLSIFGVIAQRIKLRDTVYRSIDKVVCISHLMEREMAGFGVQKNQLVYIPNGIQLKQLNAKQPKKIRENIRVVSIMARFADVKNPLLHINAAILLKKRHPEVAYEYTIFGSGELFEQCRELVRNENATEYIKLPGSTANDIVLAALEQANLFINVSKMEGLSNAIIEAMSVGVPCLVSNVGGAEDLIGDNTGAQTMSDKTPWIKCQNGGLVEAKISPEQLAEVLYLMLSDKTYLIAAGERARKHIEKEFTIDVVIEKYKRQYELLLREVD